MIGGGNLTWGAALFSCIEVVMFATVRHINNNSKPSCFYITKRAVSLWILILHLETKCITLCCKKVFTKSAIKPTGEKNFPSLVWRTICLVTNSELCMNTLTSKLNTRWGVAPKMKLSDRKSPFPLAVNKNAFIIIRFTPPRSECEWKGVCVQVVKMLSYVFIKICRLTEFCILYCHKEKFK